VYLSMTRHCEEHSDEAIQNLDRRTPSSRSR
jgi:hypothetical protein